MLVQLKIIERKKSLENAKQKPCKIGDVAGSQAEVEFNIKI
jgi:hypothetical protein